MNILVTGGTGTFGHALCRQVEDLGLDYKFTILARSELSLARMRARFPYHRYVIGDVRDYNGLLNISHGHEGIIHAAAMKRIPESQDQPDECYKTNVLGSYNVVLAAQAAKVSWCLGISTDKACRATTTYGASKLMMEGLFLGSVGRTSTQFCLVRYGNIISSNGSVIPTWRSQYDQGKYLTITHEEMTRFWMSPKDAISLVLTRIAISHLGGILVPKMKSLSVMDMISMLFPGARTITTGLRSTEKVHEDLVDGGEMCAEWDARHYMVRGPSGALEGDLGTSYSSQEASRLTREEVLHMLKDAEQLEELMK